MSTHNPLNVAIAKALGSRIFTADGTQGHAWCGGSKVYSAGGYYQIVGTTDGDGQEKVVQGIPDYAGDMNAAREACLTLLKTEENCDEFWHMLSITTRPNKGKSHQRKLAATPAQWCEAVLMVLDKAVDCA